MQTLNTDTQAILLFTACFGKPADGEPKPLTPTEWGRFASWLKDRNTRPGKLLADGLSKALSDWHDRTISLDRLQALLDRGAALAIAVEKWQRSGIWIMTRSDPDYPRRLKQRLEVQAPPVMFGCGSRRLLNAGGIAVVGSRRANEDDLDFARALGRKVATSGMTVISGGARGIDEAAMLGTLEVEGTVVGVLADSLLRAAISQKYRQGICRQNLVLVSPFNPEAGFNAGNAMARNKYIYCLSDAAVVVESGKSGGTWNGATENLRKGWVRLWVKPSTGLTTGNAELVRLGGHWLSHDFPEGAREELFTAQGVDDLKSQESITGEVCPEATAEMVSEPMAPVVSAHAPAKDDQPGTESWQNLSLYTLFCMKLRSLLAERPRQQKELREALPELNGKQLQDWLNQAVEDRFITKHKRPVLYELAGRQLSMLEGD